MNIYKEYFDTLKYYLTILKIDNEKEISRCNEEDITKLKSSKENFPIAYEEYLRSIGNGVPCHSTFIKKTFSDNMPMKVYKEELPNGHKHLLLKINQPFESDKANAAMVVVPKDAYYILGDNRDNSLDSRYIGFITKDKIKGRVLYSFWGRTGKKRMNIDFTQQ